MADKEKQADKPWAAIAAAIGFGVLGAFHYYTVTALEAQSEGTRVMIDAANRASQVETAGLRTRQQLILAEIRALREEAGANHGGAAVEEAGEPEGGAEAEGAAEADANE